MRQPIIPYRPDLTERACELRGKMALAEVLMWQQLKGKQHCGYDFDRQKPVGRRIVDFYCKDLALAVDVDGSVHDHMREQDERRHEAIEVLGITHLRFWNYEVKNDMDSVLKRIEDWIRAEEMKRGWSRREPPVKFPRSRATRMGRPTPNPSKGGEQHSNVPTTVQPPEASVRPHASSPPGRGQGWVRPTAFQRPT